MALGGRKRRGLGLTVLVVAVLAATTVVVAADRPGTRSDVTRSASGTPCPAGYVRTTEQGFRRAPAMAAPPVVPQHVSVVGPAAAPAARPPEAAPARPVVAQVAHERATWAVLHLCGRDHALDLPRAPGRQRSNRTYMCMVFVAQRQMQQQIGVAAQAQLVEFLPQRGSGCHPGVRRRGELHLAGHISHVGRTSVRRFVISVVRCSL